MISCVETYERPVKVPAKIEYDHEVRVHGVLVADGFDRNDTASIRLIVEKAIEIDREERAETDERMAEVVAAARAMDDYDWSACEAIDDTGEYMTAIGRVISATAAIENGEPHAD